MACHRSVKENKEEEVVEVHIEIGETNPSKNCFSLEDLQELKELQDFFGVNDIKTSQSFRFKVPPYGTLESLFLYFAGINPEKMELKKEDYSPDTFINLIYIVNYFTDVEPLRRLSQYFSNARGDAYFWMHLARSPEFFYIHLRDELIRQRKIVIPKGNGTVLAYDYMQCQTKICNEENLLEPELFSRSIGEQKKNLIRFFQFTPTATREKKEETKPEQMIRFTYLQRDPGAFLRQVYQKWISSEYEMFFKILNDLLDVPGVAICGGFVLSLLNPTYKMLRSVLDRRYPTQTVHYQGKHYQGRMILPSDIDLFLYYEPSTQEEKEEDKKEDLSSRCSTLYIEKRLRQLFQVFYTHNRPVKMEYFQNSVTLRCKFSQSHPLYSVWDIRMKFQIIKRLYQNVQEILLGFDLDPCACALIRKEKKQKFIVLPRCRNAIMYGITIVNPGLQSSTFNYRLVKYFKRGYSPYIPGGIHKLSFWMEACLEYQANPQNYYHTFVELLSVFQRNFPKSKFYHCREVSDYSIEHFKNVLLEPRVMDQHKKRLLRNYSAGMRPFGFYPACTLGKKTDTSQEQEFALKTCILLSEVGNWNISYPIRRSMEGLILLFMIIFNVYLIKWIHCDIYGVLAILLTQASWIYFLLKKFF